MRRLMESWTGRLAICGGGLMVATWYAMWKLAALASAL